jgi:hypothetical protein
MNQYFFNVTKEERENILDKHKTIYDGYVTEYAQGNMYPLTVQDLANDKKGITVNNKGEVSEYKNVAINEMRFDGKSTGLFEDEEDNEMEIGAPLDMIADREDDVKHGTVDFDDEIENFDLGDVIPFDGDEYDESFDFYLFDDNDEEEVEDEETVLTLGQDFDEDLIEPLQEQLDKTREMFLRFNKYN